MSAIAESRSVLGAFERGELPGGSTALVRASNFFGLAVHSQCVVRYRVERGIGDRDGALIDVSLLLGVVVVVNRSRG